ncbi:hypothetical protein ALI144C_41505 [Actinosynnema sp. ALI-1.44]|uniref:DUF998 domain-containing protein n=1 Tax=Actinosynnema sp. ALI-1.44 TaxID=1933779 RepID=UPI00097C5FE2|nr:DUF998 domain-containing protein [Actinosynnema sp. ALI-1.44]ONI75216.1 hypothetical protein ALI144C_41505 [Actinosynnema sp. ALI-1.44]
MTFMSPSQGQATPVPTTAVSARTQPWLVMSAAAISWGVLAFVVLHLVSGRNPFQDAVSFYAFTDQAPGLLSVSILLVAIGSATTLAALNSAGIPLSRTTRVLFGCWSGGLALAAAFPVAYGELSSALSGEIHQYACVAAFLSIPVLGFSLLKRTRGIPGLTRNHAALTRWTRYSVAGLALFGLSYLIAKVPAFSELSTILPVGLTQRITLTVDIGLLYSTLHLARRASTPVTEPFETAPEYADFAAEPTSVR